MKKSMLFAISFVLLLGAIPQGFIAFGSDYDSTPPVVGAVTANPASIDLSGGNQTIQVSAQITDDGVGVRSAYFQAIAPGYGRSNYHLYNGTASLVSGTDKDGIWQAAITIPANAEPGTWSLTGVASD